MKPVSDATRTVSPASDLTQISAHTAVVAMDSPVSPASSVKAMKPGISPRTDANLRRLYSSRWMLSCIPLEKSSSTSSLSTDTLTSVSTTNTCLTSSGSST